MPGGTPPGPAGVSGDTHQLDVGTLPRIDTPGPSIVGVSVVGAEGAAAEATKDAEIEATPVRSA
jgi:hypothetical protein